MIRTLLLAFFIFLTHALALSGQSPGDPAEIEHSAVTEILNTASTVQISPILTDSPRRTIETFFRLHTDLEKAVSKYTETRTVENYAQVHLLNTQFISLIDTSLEPAAKRQKAGSETSFYLLDALGRVPEINPKNIPDIEALDDPETAKYRLPGTPFHISMVTSGSRTGEFLFAAETIRSAPRFYEGIRSMKLRSALPIKSWNGMSRQISGPLIPVSALSDLPAIFTFGILDTPVWKVLLVMLSAVTTYVGLRFWHRILTQKLPQSARNTPRYRILSPVALMLTTLLLEKLFEYQINITGRFYDLQIFLLVIAFYIAATWAFWLSSRAFFDTVILDPTFPRQSLDSSMVSLVGQIIGLIGGLLIVGYGASELGVPVLSMLTGLGIGGIAVALAVRPTLENLIGGFVLYLDRPVRVGDYCTFGDQNGTIESIGVRSTAIRASDRTLITIPNAQFADMHLINWARCDEMLIEEVIGLRYGTDPDQLRFVLAKIREMFHAHPRISPATVRVRFSGFGRSELNISIRVYAQTREWNDFHAIREDVLFRIVDIVAGAGCEFALPTQTLFLKKEPERDTDLAEKATKTVASWRQHKTFPFPKMSAERAKKLEGTLQYPPPGSPDSTTSDETMEEGSERLSSHLEDVPPSTETEREGSPP
jgi:MscS family membrane protein